MHRGLLSAARSFGRELVAPPFSSPEIERAFIVQTFSGNHVTTMVLFSIVNVMQVFGLWFAEDEMQRRRLYPLIISMVLIVYARHRHTPSYYPDQQLAHCRFSMWAALLCAAAIPIAKALAPKPNMPVLLIAGIHLVAIMTVRLHHYGPLPRVVIHAGIFAANMEGSRWLTALALGCGELAGGIFARDACIAFHKLYRDLQRLDDANYRIQRSHDEAEQRLREELCVQESIREEREQERQREKERHEERLAEALRVAAAQEELLEALRASNERREYEIQMIQKKMQREAGAASTCTSSDETNNKKSCHSHHTAKFKGTRP